MAESPLDVFCRTPIWKCSLRLAMLGVGWVVTSAQVVEEPETVLSLEQTRLIDSVFIDGQAVDHRILEARNWEKYIATAEAALFARLEEQERALYAAVDNAAGLGEELRVLADTNLDSIRFGLLAAKDERMLLIENLAVLHAEGRWLLDQKVVAEGSKDAGQIETYLSHLDGFGDFCVRSEDQLDRLRKKLDQIPEQFANVSTRLAAGGRDIEAWNFVLQSRRESFTRSALEWSSQHEDLDLVLREFDSALSSNLRLRVKILRWLSQSRRRLEFYDLHSQRQVGKPFELPDLSTVTIREPQIGRAPEVREDSGRGWERNDVQITHFDFDANDWLLRVRHTIELGHSLVSSIWGCLEKVDRGLGGFGDVVLV